jgi:outer membrane receptor protein involved in Fe transport
MKNRFMAEGPRPLPTECNGTQRSLAPLIGLGFAVAILAAAPAAAEEPEPVVPAGDPESQEAPPDLPTEPEPGSEWDPSLETDIEEILIFGSESEATGDFQAADSVTGFSTDDLSALGVQDIADLSGFTPNLEIVTSGATTPTFFIRGVGLNDFNPNSTGAVAIYRDDVAINAPALQLSPLFDMEAVNVLRGPQGTGLARNASAGAIKLYTRKPVGEFDAFVRSELGNFNSRDFQGAVELPFIEDMVSGRFAFRLSERDGTMTNRCGKAPASGDREPVPPRTVLNAMGLRADDPPWSICGEPVLQIGLPPFVSEIPVGLPSKVNDIDNWAARGTLLFEPTYYMSWLLNAHGSRRDELTRLGQAYGTNGFFCLNGDIDNCFPGRRLYPEGSRIANVFGGPQGGVAGNYQTREVQERLKQLAPCMNGVPASNGDPGSPYPVGTCNTGTAEEKSANRALVNAAKLQVAKELAQDLDSEPWEGDFNICSPDRDVNPGRPGVQCPKGAGTTTNDTWGVYLKGDFDLPREMRLTSTTGFDTYDRFVDTDLDYSPQTLFHITLDDDGWQTTQDLQLQGTVGDEISLRWEIGGWFLREHLDVDVKNDLGIANIGVGKREYTQDLWSTAGYLSLAFDLGNDFTLDGGFRYNWEQKKLDFALFPAAQPDPPLLANLNETWDAPTGLVRLTYRFREDTHVFWKYTRGWKPGTYNATSSATTDFVTNVSFANVSIATPEEVDSFETGIRGSWFDGRMDLEFSFFYYSYADYQIFTAQQFEGGQPEFVILNADDAEMYGAEVDAVLEPWVGAFINVRFGWIESQFLDFVQLQQERVLLGNERITVNREIQNTGNSLLNSPRYKVSLTAEQELPIGSWGSITARYDGVWTDTTYYDATEGRGIPNVQNFQYLPEETIAQPDFWLHNLTVTYRTPDNKIELAGWVRNIADEAYKTFAFDGSTFNNTTIFNVGDPRTYGATFTVRF